MFRAKVASIVKKNNVLDLFESMFRCWNMNVPFLFLEPNVIN